MRALTCIITTTCCSTQLSPGGGKVGCSGHSARAVVIHGGCSWLAAIAVLRDACPLSQSAIRTGIWFKNSLNRLLGAGVSGVGFSAEAQKIGLMSKALL